MFIFQPGTNNEGLLTPSYNGQSDGDNVSIRSKTPVMETGMTYYILCLYPTNPILIFVTESEGSSDEEDTREMEGRTTTKAGTEIDRASAGNVRRTKEEIAADAEAEDQFGYTTSK